MPDIINKPGQFPAALAAKAKAVRPRRIYAHYSKAGRPLGFSFKREFTHRWEPGDTIHPIMAYDLAPASVEALRETMMHPLRLLVNGAITRAKASGMIFNGIGLTQPAKRRRTKS